jgi:hypothetical protein
MTHALVLAIGPLEWKDIEATGKQAALPGSLPSFGMLCRLGNGPLGGDD